MPWRREPAEAASRSIEARAISCGGLSRSRECGDDVRGILRREKQQLKEGARARAPGRASFERGRARRPVRDNAIGWPSRPEGRLGPEGTRGCAICVPEVTAPRLRKSFTKD